MGSAIAAYKHQQWEDFGKSTGEALLKLFAGLRDMSSAVAAPDPDPHGPEWPIVLRGVVKDRIETMK